MSDRSERRRETIDAVFGDDVPQVPADERDTPSPDDDAERDRWLRENLPPHHF